MNYYRIACKKFITYIETENDIITVAKEPQHIGLHFDKFLTKVRKLFGKTWVYRIQ